MNHPIGPPTDSLPVNAFPTPADWQAINPLLDEALNLPASERGDWLDRLESDRALHRDALRALLSKQAIVESQDFLGELPAVDTTRTASPAASPPAHGHRVGPYRLIEEIGRGGMGTVWLAERADGLFDRRIALKLPHVVWDDALAERLERERAILATLEHDHIARLYDAGLDDVGRPYLAMEYVEGRPIDEWCSERALDVPARLRLLLQVMAAVSHAHAHLVVHRDLKPPNILVTTDGRVKLLDFGIARLLEDGESDRTALTRRAGLALTPNYASPEQIRGEPLATASDVYSLGVVAYQLLAGALPYQLKRGSATVLEDAIARVDPPLASEAASTQELRRVLRGDLDAILNRALKKMPAERYPSIEAFAQDVERHLRGVPVLARPDSRSYRMAKFLRRNVLAVSMTTALSMAVLAGAAVFAWQYQVARREGQRASDEVQRQRAVRDLYIEAMSRLSVLGAEHPDEFGPHAATQVLREKLDEMASRLSDRPLEREAQLEAVALQLNYNSEFEASLEVQQQFLAVLKAHDAPTLHVLSAYGSLGRTLYQLRRYDEAEATRRIAASWDEGHDDYETAMARLYNMNDLCSLLVTRGKRTEARQAITNTQAFALQRFPEHLYRFMNLYQLARLDSGFDDVHELVLARQAHQGIVTFGEIDPDSRTSDLQFYGIALSDNGDNVAAEAAFREQLAFTEPDYGIASPNSVRQVARLASTVARTGELKRARAELAEERQRLAAMPQGMTPWARAELEAREVDIALLAGDAALVKAHPLAITDAAFTPRAMADAQFAIQTQALALALAGRPSDGVELMSKLRDHWADPDRPSLQWVRILQTLAMCQLSADRPQDALDTLHRLAAVLEREGALIGRAGAVTLELQALAAARVGLRDEAERSLAAAIPMATDTPFPSAVDRADSLLRRAEAHALLGRGPEAAQAARAALDSMPGQVAGSPRLVRARELAG